LSCQALASSGKLNNPRPLTIRDASLARVGYVRPLRLLVKKRVGYVRPLRMEPRGRQG
jgi:hypothetical protein